MGLMYFKNGSLSQAMSEYNNALKLNSKFAEAYNNRAIVYYTLKEYDKAWGDLNRARASGFLVNPDFLKALEEASGVNK